MNLRLNLMNGKAGSNCFEPVNIKEQEFWKSYLRLLGTINEDSQSLSRKEVEILSFVLSQDPNISYFRGPGAKIIKEKYNLSAPSLSALKSELLTKNYLQETGVVRGDALPKGNLGKFQRYVKAKGIKNISFVFSFSIDE